MTHLGPSELAALLDGKLSREPAESAAAHLNACADCRQLAERLTEVPRDLWAALVVAAERPARPERPAAPEFPGYRVLEELGRGGCGVVYRAEEDRTGRVVAIKVMRAGAMAGPTEQAWFQSEAQSAARLQHPNIVVVHSVGEAFGLPYYVMEYLAAGSLADRLDGTPLALDDSARMVESIARAAHYAHEAGVIHRDLKPGNILLAFSSEPGTTYQPKLSDFGMAKRPDVVGGTPTQSVLGTPSYMSPEQAFGNSRDVGPATDVYSLGAILYELLTGRPPFKGATPYETLLLARDQEPVPPRSLRPGIPRDLDTICLKCLEKDPRRRYGTALALADDLRAFQEGKAVSARPIGSVERLIRQARRYPATAAVSVLSLLFAVGAITVVTVLWRVAEWRRGQLVQAGKAVKKRHESLLKTLLFGADLTSRYLQNATLASKLDREAVLKQLDEFERFPELSDSPAVEMKFAFALLQIGTALDRIGEEEHADRVVEKAASTLRRLARAYPDRLFYAYHYAESCIELAGRLEKRGLIDEGIRQREEAVRVSEALVALNTGNDAFSSILASFQGNLARSYRLAGRHAEGEHLVRLGYQEHRRLVDLYPEDQSRYGAVAFAGAILTDFLVGRPDRVDELVAMARDRIELCEKARSQADWHLMAEHLMRPELALDLRVGGRNREADEYMEYLMKIRREFATRGHDSPRNRNFLITALIELGHQAWQEDRRRACAFFREALESLDAEMGMPDSSVFVYELTALLIACPDPSIRDRARGLDLARSEGRTVVGPTAWVYASLAAEGEDPEALEQLEKQLARDNFEPTDPMPMIGHFHLARVFEKKGRTAEASAQKARAEHLRKNLLRMSSQTRYILEAAMKGL